MLAGWLGLQNSSGAALFADWPKVPDASGNFVGAVTLLSKALREKVSPPPL
eukprot:COSAG03_NODE_12723_length_534_cov_0.979310_1_plen_50_part_10